MSTPLNRNGFNCILPGRNFEAAQKINAEQLQYKDLFIQLKKHNEQQNHATLITNMDSFAAQVLHKYHDLTTHMEFQRAIDIMYVCGIYTREWFQYFKHFLTTRVNCSAYFEMLVSNIKTNVIYNYILSFYVIFQCSEQNIVYQMFKLPPQHHFKANRIFINISNILSEVEIQYIVIFIILQYVNPHKINKSNVFVTSNVLYISKKLMQKLNIQSIHIQNDKQPNTSCKTQQHATPLLNQILLSTKYLQNKLHYFEGANGDSVRRFDV
ncbi:Hypothetical_protein [Hexamita inflata]|uniref:Hypothetical_protein n=1 Tax=Hexamita inflata TaxID=28002 RepID=A0AA86RLF0_9EUKA|nr:Hypothetical protein HINF_LOCUS64618 [Hexamita inflata]